ncbi:MAG: site-specific integrase, partial [Candidatus Binataceae bacterium]
MTGYPARTASFPTRRLAERWAIKTEADMIEGRHFRGIEARRRTLAEAIDRYVQHEVPKLRDGRMHRYTLPWWREKIGRLKLSDITPALLVEYRDKLGAETFVRATPGSKRSIVKGEPRRFRRSGATVNRY